MTREDKRGPPARLVLTYDEGEAGKTELVVGADYRVEKVVNVSPRGVTRWMTYEHQLIGGRNLVTVAVLKTKIHQDTKLPKRGEAVMKASDGTRFEIGYRKVGRYHLPASLRKAMPVPGSVVTIAFDYQSAHP